MSTVNKEYLTIKLTSPYPSWPLILQTPGASGIWGDVRFVVDNELAEADFWVVLEDLPRTTKTICPPSRTLLITGEPPAIKRYPSAFVRQFAHVLTCQPIHHEGRIQGHSANTWHYGRLCNPSGEDEFVESYDSLKSVSPFEKKERQLSVAPCVIIEVA